MMLLCSMLIMPSVASSKNVTLLRDERCVVAQRLEIVLERSNAAAQFLAVGSICEHLTEESRSAAAARAGKRECSSTDRPCDR